MSTASDHNDAAGTPVAMSDINGNLVWKADYMPFGQVRSTTGAPDNDMKFVGKELDAETGLYCFGGRYLDPRTGRFLTVDPVGSVDPRTGKVNQAILLDPQRLNRYAYGLNNPYKYVDPDGKEVTIVILRENTTLKSILSSITVHSDQVKDSFKGYVLEPVREKGPVPSGEYSAFIREDRNPNRVELHDVPHNSNIQIHTGNNPSDSQGCFLVGESRSRDFVGNSVSAMTKINDIITKDGSGNIEVRVTWLGNEAQ
jgi:RHS repeat-associated protein